MSSKFTHNIQTIELTKLLERVGCETLSQTKHLGHDFLSGAGIAQPVLVGPGQIMIQAIRQMPNVQSMGTLSLFPNLLPRDVGAPHNLWRAGSTFELITPSSTILLTHNNPSGVDVLIINPIILTEAGEFTLRGRILLTSVSGGQSVPLSITVDFNFSVIEQNIPPKTPATITDIINRALEVIPVRREGIEPQRFVLDPVWAERLSQIRASEYFAPQKNLYENLLIAVSKAHLIPRLKWCNETDSPRIISFDELGGNVHRDISQYRESVYEAETNLDQYCSEIDSTVSNVVDTIDEAVGTVVEPSAGGYKSLRAPDDAIEIYNDNALFSTTFPIYKVTKAFLAPTSGAEELDITPFIYEQAEYDALRSDGLFPNSKRFALFYRQGDNKIKGFGFRSALEAGTSNDGLFARWTEVETIRNIFRSLTGRDISGRLHFNSLALRVEYIPITSARIVQKKPFVGDMLEGNSLIYNQGGSTVEAQHFGENMKGAIARMGNTLEHKTYYFKRYKDIPKIGELVEGKFVCNVAKSYEIEHIKATITLAENFNDLSRYIGISSNARFYDVSEKQSYERHISYSEDVVIGDQIGGDTTAEFGFSMAYPRCRHRFMSSFGREHPDTANERPTVAILTGRTAGIQQARIAVPVISQAYGNTLCFTTRYQDNFSAGNQRLNLTGQAFKREQRAVQYGDVYGEIDTIEMSLWNGLFNEAAANLERRHNLPEYNTAVGDGLLFGTTDLRPFLIRKDSREAIEINYQLCMRTNRRSIVLGSALTRQNSLLTGKTNQVILGFFAKPLNRLNSTITKEMLKPDNYMQGRDLLVFAGVNFGISVGNRATSETLSFTQCKSYGVFIPKFDGETLIGGELLLGENGDFEAVPASGFSGSIGRTFFNFPDNRYKEHLTI